MGRKPRVDRTAEEKWQILQEGLKGANVSETCRRRGLAQTLFYRRKDEQNKEQRQRLGEKPVAPGSLFEPGSSLFFSECLYP